MDDEKDVLVFTMSVYEFAKTCPEQTRYFVYVNYIDSVAYVQPKSTIGGCSRRYWSRT
ncbi:unnamed protein product [Ectocarpus sp. 12 AP-2014]